MKRWNVILPTAIIAAAILCAGAYGADSAANDAEDAESAGAEPATNCADDETTKRTRVDLTLYTWLSSITADVKAGDAEVSSDMSLSDILDALDFANFAHLEVQRGKWGLFSELDFIKLSNDVDFRKPSSGVPFKVHADGVLKQTIIELGAIRSFERPRVGIDVLAGARYFRMDSDMHVGPIRTNITKDWVDPLVGARLRFPLSDKWQASLRGDLAGFGVGSGSKLTTNAIASVGYSISDRYLLAFGYRYLEIDYEKNAVDLDIKTYGPVLGMVIRF